MPESKFPENFSEHGKEFNRVSFSDREKLDARGQNEFDMIETQKNMERKKIEADNERYRDQRIDKEIDRLLRTPAPGMNGPTPPHLGGRRADQPSGVTRERLSPDELHRIRETAERNIRKMERKQLDRIEQTFGQAQRDLLDRALGQDRYPARER